jgi:hypothetical protein
MSQLPPEGKLLNKLIEKSKEGIQIEVITSKKDSPQFTTYPYKISLLYFKWATRNNKNIRLIHLPQQVHAKLMIIDKKIALFGSHNLVSSGVILGTEEIAIETTDEMLIKHLITFSCHPELAVPRRSFLRRGGSGSIGRDP